MKKRLLFILVCFLSLAAHAQVDVKPDYTKPYFQGSVKVEDTLGIQKKIILKDDATIQDSLGSSILNLKNFGVEGQIDLTGKGIQLNAGAFFSSDTAIGNLSLGVSGTALSLFKSDFTKIGQISIALNENGSISTGNFPSYPTFLSSQNSIVAVGVVNSNILGGLGTTAKTNNTAYVNQIGFNMGEAFETLLNYTTATQDNTITLPDASGTVSLNNIYDGDGTIGAGRVATLTDDLTFSEGALNVERSDAGTLLKLTRTSDGIDRLNISDNTAVYRSQTHTFEPISGNAVVNVAGGNSPQMTFDTDAFGNTLNIKGGNRPTFTSLNSGQMSFFTSVGTAFANSASVTPAAMVHIQSTGTGTEKAFLIEDSGTIDKFVVLGNGSVGVGTSSPDASSFLDVSSTTKGFLKPRMTTGQRDAIVSPATGLEIYNTTTNQHNFYNGVLWLVSNGIYSGDGNIPSNTRSTITDQLIFNTNTVLGGITLNEISGTLPNALTFATGGSSGVTGVAKLQIGVSQGNSQFMTGTTAGDPVLEFSQKTFLGGPSVSTMVIDAANQSVGIGTTAPDASSVLDATSTTKGFLPPRMTGTQAEAIISPADGLMIFSIDGSGVTITAKGWWGYDGATWIQF